MDFKSHPTLKEFSDQLNYCLNEIGMDNEGNINTHNIRAGINIEDSRNTYSIIGIDLEYLIGCSCPADITIRVRKDKNDD